jgi:thiazolinyl imide reductase
MALNRVLVCGSNYGRFYLSAIRGAGSLQLVGILARGSDRSRRIAQRHGVPLYQAPDELPEAVDIACAAMSSSANEVVFQLLDRGIHVLWEHPQRARAVQEALARARHRQSRLHINGHFPDLPAPRAFIRRCAQLCLEEPIRFLDVMVSDRVLYAGLDIVARATGHHRLDEPEVTSRLSSMVMVQATLAGAPARFWVQTGGSGDQVLEDGSSDYLLDCRVVAVFGSGVLTLLSLTGPVVWNRNGGTIQKPDEEMWSSLLEAVIAAQLREQRDQANLAAIKQLVTDISEGIVPPAQRPDYLLGISTAWEQLGRLLGSERK